MIHVQAKTPRLRRVAAALEPIGLAQAESPIVFRQCLSSQP
jgi:hypothetical protein